MDLAGTGVKGSSVSQAVSQFLKPGNSLKGLNFKFSIYIKPTQSNVKIVTLDIHKSHKLSSINCLLNR
jgi:hypothetical protein